MSLWVRFKPFFVFFFINICLCVCHCQCVCVCMSLWVLCVNCVCAVCVYAHVFALTCVPHAESGVGLCLVPKRSLVKRTQCAPVP